MEGKGNLKTEGGKGMGVEEEENAGLTIPPLFPGRISWPHSCLCPAECTLPASIALLLCFPRGQPGRCHVVLLMYEALEHLLIYSCQ